MEKQIINKERGYFEQYEVTKTKPGHHLIVVCFIRDSGSHFRKTPINQ